MAMNISRAQLEKLRKRAQGLQSRVANLREKADEMTGQLIQTTEIGVASFGMGLVNGRFVGADGRPGVEVLGIPIDLGSAVALHAFAFLAGGKYSEHLHNFGDGALAAYLTTMGTGIGTRMRERAAAAAVDAGGGAAAGYRPRMSSYAGTEELSDAELAALARA